MQAACIDMLLNKCVISLKHIIFWTDGVRKMEKKWGILGNLSSGLGKNKAIQFFFTLFPRDLVVGSGDQRSS